jgi:hypothetical protein
MVQSGLARNRQGNAQTAQTPKREFLDHEKFTYKGLDYNQLDTTERAPDE